MNHTALDIIRHEHAAVAAMLRSMQMLLKIGPGDAPERFFDVLRAMLFYIDEFPERRHHPKESDLLFPRLVRCRPELMPVIRRLEEEHHSGERRVRDLQHMLLAWELLGDARREAFCEQAEAYVGFYLEHMRVEETQVLPVAATALTAEDWAVLNPAFAADQDPLAVDARNPSYERLFSRIVLAAPAPIGVGPALASA